jgi:hypothetical protein
MRNADRDSAAGRGSTAPVLVAALAAVAFAAGALAGCGGAGTQNRTAVLTPVERAADTTAAGPGYRFTLTTRSTIAGQSAALIATGSIDERLGEGSLNMRLGPYDVDEVQSGPYVYVRVPGGAGLAGTDRPWVKANLYTFAEAMSADNPVAGDTSGPAQLLGILRSGGAVTTVGREEVGGVPTTHYHALVDFSRYAATVAPSRRAGVQSYAEQLQRMTGSSTLPVDVWIDEEQRIRRFQTSLQVCTKEGKLADQIAMDIYGYGPQPVVSVPPASQTTDITGALRSRISQSLAQLSC